MFVRPLCAPVFFRIFPKKNRNYDSQMEVDNAIAMADEQGIEHALGIEADGHARAFMLTAGKQFYYGNSSGLGDANGFPGTLGIVDASMILDAGGTTDNTATSVWAICAAPKFFETIYANNSVMNTGDWRKQSITRTVSGTAGEVTAWKNSLEGWIGSAFYSKYACARIKKLTADAGKGLTDSLLAQLLELFPIGVRPTHFFMTRRSRRQLQVSRTVTLMGQGKSRPDQEIVAPIPTSYDDIPIIATDSILNTETLAL